MTIFNVTWDGFLQTASCISWYEIGMLFCFGASWPFSISKLIKTKNAKGKSIVFLVLIMLGYVFGILHKVFFQLDVVVLLYLFLLFVVLIDCLLSIRYRKGRQGESKTQ